MAIAGFQWCFGNIELQMIDFRRRLDYIDAVVV